MENTKAYKSFTDLEVWQQARAFKLAIYSLIKSFPKYEKYNLEEQITRSCRSIAANISEGYGRYTYKEQIRFCMNARGSLYETQNHLIDAYDCNYITPDVLSEYTEKAKSVERLLNGYISWLRNKTKDDN